MKRKLLKLLSWIIVLIVIIVVLNIKVSTKQGINYGVSTLKIPLYLKILDFFDRHYNYKLIVERIIGDSSGEKERVLKIFEWTYKNIRKTPEGYPMIDDHVWNIIVRGYGEDDQSSDVFTALCNYAGADAFYSWVDSGKNDRYLVLSFVRIKGRWNVFDPYNGVYFKNKAGDLANTDEIKIGNFIIVNICCIEKKQLDYKDFIANFPDIKEARLQRANIQSPCRRFIFWLKHHISFK